MLDTSLNDIVDSPDQRHKELDLKKAALHKLFEKSSLNVRFVYKKYKDKLIGRRPQKGKKNIKTNKERN